MFCETAQVLARNADKRLINWEAEAMAYLGEMFFLVLLIERLPWYIAYPTWFLTVLLTYIIKSTSPAVDAPAVPDQR